MRKPIATTTLGAASFLLFTAMVHADEIRVLSTQATEEAYRELVPQFEKASGHKVTTVFTGTLDANKRLAAGETYDLLIMSAPSIDEHIKAGKVVPGSRVEAEIGFQQVSELSHFAGVDYVGPLPADIQRFTTFSSGIIAGAKTADAAKALVKFITAPAAADAFKRRGMEPG
jgi:ABC-type molybdate transport system substrate-binding protein